LIISSNTLNEYIKKTKVQYDVILEPTVKKIEKTQNLSC